MHSQPGEKIIGVRIPINLEYITCTSCHSGSQAEAEVFQLAVVEDQHCYIETDYFNVNGIG